MSDWVVPSDRLDAHEVARASAEVMLAADEATRSAGIRLLDVGPGTARMAMTLLPDMLNGHGTAHGGWIFLLADTAFAVACNSYAQRTVAAGCDIVFVAPARAGDVLVAEAVERVRAGRSGVYDVTVRRTNDESAPGAGEVVAEFRGRSRTVPGSLLDRDAPATP